MSKTVAYIRVSTNKQLEGAGPLQQRDAITAFAFSRQLVIDEIAIDDETGTTEDREQIQRLLTEARSGLVKTLLVDRIDRLGRSLHVSESLHSSLTEAGCTVLVVQGEFDSSKNTPEADLVRQMFGAMAQYQRTTLLRHMKACRQSKARQRGYFEGGSVPYGYVFDQTSGRIVPSPTEAPLIQRIFRLRDAGFGFSKSCRVLQAEGWKTRKGTPFQAAQIQRIIQCEKAYKGLCSFVDESSTAIHSAIL